MSGIRICFIGLAMFWAGCGDDDRGGGGGDDAGPMDVDAGPETDGGEEADSGGMDLDSGMMEVDAGPTDSGPVCGDGATAGAETCDDGNTTAGDGCSAACDTEAGYVCSGEPSVCTTTCGDGVVAGAEACDDAGSADGDGCSASCTVESGWLCSGSPSVCSTTCGDGMVVGAEACDDGGTTDGDGCSATCTVEAGFTCMGSPSTCGPTCGDGMVIGAEACDDGNTTAGDGCDATCTREAGFVCTGSPSACVPVCGDGMVVGVEACDDGGTTDGDGCSATCTVEAGFTCMGSPSTCGPMCGDGVRIGAEVCDDGDVSDLDCCSATCTRLCTEVENNGTTATANPIVAGTPVTGGIEPAADVDYWVFTLTAPSNLVIETFDGMGGPCTTSFDTYVELFAADGTTRIDFDDDTGTGNCSLITAMTDAPVRALPAGTYYIRVRAFSSSAVLDRYTLSLTATMAGCGDGFTVAPETCDDGNTMAGDGCDATCRIEVRCGNGVLEAGEACDDGDMSDLDCCSTTCMRLCTELEPNDTPMTANPLAIGTPVTGAIDRAGDVDVWAITLAAPANVRVETFDGSGVDCVAINTTVDLRAPDGTTNLITDFDDGINLCSLINPMVDAPARGLAAGTYYIRVRASSTTATIDRYTLVVTTTPLVCGDSFFTPASGEECDDGNTTNGDGCSATCTREAPIVTETEPNEDGTPMTGGTGTTGNDYSSATANGPYSTDVRISAAFAVAGDEDVFALTNPGAAPVMVRLETATDAIASLCPSPTDTVVHVRDAAGVSLASNDDSGIGNCSLLTYTIAAGATVYVHLSEYGDDATLASYYLFVDFL